MADNNDLNGAKNKIIDAQSMLDDVDLQGTVKMFEMLKQELDQFMAYLQSPELYKKHGRAFALSTELCHARQRFAARVYIAIELGGLLTLVVQGFILNIAPVKGYTTIEKVSARDYETTELGDGTVNVTFGVLYQKETRRVMVGLVLFEVPKRVSRPVVSVQGKASNDLELDKLENKEFGNISSARVIRTPNFKGLEKDEVIIEESRLETAK
ncbi:hypothetical protein POM88_006947 [Heracleum sosnowskyi]|uniref:VWA-Hint protein Vwaint domain-containing protein n=1 Tax=Heracleum sosnowskyi TaxID=360622 RepID=A0AAD8N563_9APIA|nr:hypothetical protein POM88_006947 [Heracleum sosnowskyi]